MLEVLNIYLTLFSVAFTFAIYKRQKRNMMWEDFERLSKKLDKASKRFRRSTD